ncbi:PH domain-containing protein [Roseospira goensis]|uniref:Bacterial Pleckstrin homology domain-containing protein n=1 Tax=Roseospira goensis TaxID=391922 RepID=A0A7W6RYE2_9PROT|nr:PH domain-containing protein [Roseospira goensis]MBB4285356.1 hypothetical protein [Roseospira goensis]
MPAAPALRSRAAPPSGVVVAVSTLVGGLAAGMVGAVALWPAQWGLGLAAAGLLALMAWTFLRAPVGYTLDGGSLTIHLRRGRKTLGAVACCAPVEAPLAKAVRLWGNGGLFGFTGLYWSKRLGRYHAWLTDPRRAVRVEMTDGRRVVISPADPTACTAARPAG